MSRSLYEIDKVYLNLFNDVDEETGEIKFDEELLENLNIEFEQKADNIACLIKDKLAMIEARKQEAKSLKEKADRDEKEVEYLKNYLLKSLELRDKKKIETARNTIGTRKSKAVDIINEFIIPSEFIKKEVVSKIDKKLIKEVITSGKKVDGALLKENVSLLIK